MQIINSFQYLNTKKTVFVTRNMAILGIWIQITVHELTLQCSIKLFASSNLSLHCVPTYSIQKWICLLAISAWKANSRSSSNETSKVLSNRQAHYRVPATGFYPFYTADSGPHLGDLLSFHLCLLLSRCFSLSGFATIVFYFPFSHVCHIAILSSLLIRNSKNIQREYRITKFLTL